MDLSTPTTLAVDPVKISLIVLLAVLVLAIIAGIVTGLVLLPASPSPCDHTCCTSTCSSDTSVTSSINQQAIQPLSSGNQTFIDSAQFAQERANTEAAQTPSYIIVSCSDSRVSIPLIFNQPYLGKIFEVKTAGQALASSDLESLAYSIDNLEQNVMAIVVVGHTHCGAVHATVESLQDTDEGMTIRRTYPTIVQNIIHSARKASCAAGVGASMDDVIHLAEIQNAIDKAEEIEFLLDGSVPVIPAIYDIVSGLVTWL